MIRIFILITIGLILALKVDAKKAEGIIYFENDTINVIFDLPMTLFTKELNLEKLQYSVAYFDSTGKKIILTPDDAKEIRFRYEYENVRMVSRINSLRPSIYSTGKNIFLRIEINGRLKLFNFYSTQSSPGMYNSSTGGYTAGYSQSVERYILQKGDGELKRLKALTFTKDMAEYFSDCPKLVEKIQNKDFRKDDIQSIVRFYNSNCK